MPSPVKTEPPIPEPNPIERGVIEISPGPSPGKPKPVNEFVKKLFEEHKPEPNLVMNFGRFIETKINFEPYTNIAQVLKGFHI